MSTNDYELCRRLDESRIPELLAAAHRRGRVEGLREFSRECDQEAARLDSEGASQSALWMRNQAVRARRLADDAEREGAK